jgi:hypothetical protein
LEVHLLVRRSRGGMIMTENKSASKRRWFSLSWLRDLNGWLGMLALGIPVLGAIWIVVYAFSTPGSHGTYLGVGMLTAVAALLSGCLIGFLFGVPRVVSSGQARLDPNAPSSDYTPSSNLSEVSDWLTKLLLGAGLVQLTRLGVPIGNLINHIAGALYVTPAYEEAAKVAAGTILFGYVAIGLLDGYVVTTVWYQRELTRPKNGPADGAASNAAAAPAGAGAGAAPAGAAAAPAGAGPDDAAAGPDDADHANG